MNRHNELYQQAIRIARNETMMLATNEHIYILYDVLSGRACHSCQLPIVGTSAFPRLCRACYEAQEDARDDV